LKIPQDFHTIKGVWRFEDETERKCEEDLVYGGHIVGAVEVLGDVSIFLNYRFGSIPIANIFVGQTKLPHMFLDSWTKTFWLCFRRSTREVPYRIEETSA
jgi:hypothetical protein